MKYFCKFLPVGGYIAKPIKGVIFPEDKAKEAVIVDIADTEENNKITKQLERHFAIEGGGLKLFLCTHNISEEDWKSEGIVHIYHKPKNKFEEKPFKVIGEISPEATFVKEGDEFEDYHMTTFYMGESEYGWDKERPWEPLKQEKNFCTVKGPCGHYH